MRSNCVPLLMDTGLILYALLLHDGVVTSKKKMVRLWAYALVCLMHTIVPFFIRKHTVSYDPLAKKRSGGLLLRVMNSLLPLETLRGKIFISKDLTIFYNW